MKSILNICIGLWLSTSMAQSYLDVGFFSYATTTENSFEESDKSTRIDDLGLWIDFPIELTKKSTLLTGIYASELQLKLYPEDAKKTKLTIIGLKLGWHYQLSDRHNFSLILRPKLAASSPNLDMDAGQLGFIGLFNTIKHDKLSYKTGIYVNTEFYGMLVVPLIGIYYLNDAGNFEIDATLPVLADMNYSWPNKLAIGLNFDGVGSSYKHVLSNKQQVYVSKQSNDLFAYLKVPLGKSIFLRTKLGYSLFRKFEVYDKNDKVDLNLVSLYINDDRTVLNPLFKDGFLFNFEMVYRFHFTD